MAPATSPPVIELDRVTVTYGRRPALRDVSVRLPGGAVGLLGRNGAGKSTLLGALLGHVRPRQGRVRVLGHDVAAAPLAVRARVGYMPETDSYVAGMNAVGFVAYCARLSGLPAPEAMRRAHETLYYVGLGEARYRPIETCSAGMKQRIKLAQALVHDPDLLLLDEPTNGMDPAGRAGMLDLIRDIGHRTRIDVVLSSHLLPDVEATCDHLVVLEQGSVAADGPIAELKGPAGRVFELRIKGDRAAFAARLGEAGLECRDGDEEVLRVFVPESAGPRAVFELAARHGVQVRHLRASLPTLEDVFVRVVQAPDVPPGRGEPGTGS